MKRFLKFIIPVLFLLMPIFVYAEGNITASPSSLTIERGKSATFTIKAYNTIGDVTISSSNSSVAKVSVSEWSTGMVDEKQTKTANIKVNAVGNGNCTIVLKIDGATFDGEDLAGQTRTVNINVIDPIIYSSNNKLKDISVDGYKLIKEDNNNYSLSVANTVSSIVINASAEDTKSIVSGTGEKVLNNGENLFQIIIKAENGSKNIINIKIIRKDGYYMEDLNQVLKDDKVNEIIIRKDENQIAENQITEIKNSKKSVELSYYNENKQKIYSWILDGEKIEKSTSFNTKIEFESTYIDEIKMRSNYAEGIALSFKHNGEYPEATAVKVFVGNNFNSKDKVNLYYYDTNTKDMGFVENLEVNSDGYIEYPVSEHSEFYITKAQIENVSKDLKASENNANANVIVFVMLEILQIGIIAFLVILVVKSKKQVELIKQIKKN